MRPLENPERAKFINERLVNRPMDSAEIEHWQDLFMAWQDKLDAGKETDQGRAHWVHMTRLHLWDGKITADQLAYTVRTQYIMDLWDQEHREPPPLDAINWQTGEIKKPPYFRD